jgi:hypothetical protein
LERSFELKREQLSFSTNDLVHCRQEGGQTAELASRHMDPSTGFLRFGSGQERSAVVPDLASEVWHHLS